MSPTIRRLAFLLLLGSVGFSCSSGEYQLRPGQRTEIVATRIFTGSDGKTHAEQIKVPLTGAGPFTEVSEMAKASGVQFRRQEPHYFEDWHTAPRKQYVITLSGHGEIELSDGHKVHLGPGSILLADDLTGQGHISRGVGSEDRISIVIPVVE